VTENGLAVLPSTPIDAVVVGAGFAGLYALHRLRESGLHTVVVEAGPEVGGVWYWNRYPGARCDVPSLDYSYGFSKDLYDEWNWSERYATQPEILAYAKHVAERLDLRRDIAFGTTVAGAEWDEEAERWTVATDHGAITCRFLLLATGQVSVPNIPQIDGQETFAGNIYRTFDWPEDGVDFTGRRVALVGNGSTGIQVLPVVAPEAGGVTVFQRSATFAIPMVNHAYGEEHAAAKQEAFDARAAAATSRFGNSNVMGEESALEVSDDDRRARFESGWERGNSASILLAYRDILTDVEANATAAEFLRSKIREMVKDPQKAEILCPKGYPVGSKRPSLQLGFYEAFNRDDVSLVDIKKDPILEIVPTGIRTASGVHEVDDIVFATGFDTLTGAILRMDIRGRNGVSLREKWAHGPQTSLGLSISGFPNLFTLVGPGSPSLLSNVITSAEYQVDWIMRLLAFARDHDSRVMEATETAEKQWQEHCAEIADRTLYPLAASAYMGANIPGKPRALLPYVGGVGRYREQCEQVAADGYAGFELR
jgi:cation diffusion facilitator CzcD-associated flavoprotein CzcO